MTTEFVRGPMFYFSVLFCIAGLTYRLVRVLALGWKKDLVQPKHSKLGGSLLAFAKSAIIWPFIPRINETAGRNPVTYLAGGLFHLGLFATILLFTPHMFVWKSPLGFGWPTLPLPVIDILAVGTIIALIVLALNRMMNPVLRLLTRASDYLTLLFIFLPMLSGFFLTHRLSPHYNIMFGAHVRMANILLIWTPLSRIPHFMFYFYTKARQGAKFAQRGARP
jgi:nitrate reductase gamma subunit